MQVFSCMFRKCPYVHGMNTEDLESEVEFTRMLHTFAQTVRCNKKRPDLAGVASRREQELKGQLDELERQLAEAKEPRLPSAHDNHQQAA